MMSAPPPEIYLCVYFFCNPTKKKLEKRFFLTLSEHKMSKKRNPYVRENEKKSKLFVLHVLLMFISNIIVQALTRLSNLQGLDASSTTSMTKDLKTKGVRKGGLNFEIDFQVERDIVNSRSNGLTTPKKKTPYGITQTKSHSKEIRAMKDLTCKDEDFCRTLLEKAHWSLDKALNDFYSAQ